MRQAKTAMWLLGVPALIAGCAVADEPTTGKTTDQPIFSTAGMRVATEGILDFGATVFAENPTTLLEPLDFHKYEFDGHAGGTVTITAQATTCGDPDMVLDLFTAAEFDAGQIQLVENDDDGLPCAFDSRISNFRLPVDGTYVLLARSFRQAGSANGHYELSLTCTNNACALAGAPNAATLRVNQASIDVGLISASDLFDIGDFMFEHAFTVAEGLGNALTAAPGSNTPRPNFRLFPNNVHFAAFGAPEAQSCVTCHNIGGDDGAGDNNHNIFQNGDGINRASGLARNPPTVLGNGLRQRVGEEMTTDLLNELAAAKATVASTHLAVTKALTSKGVSFGSLVANADGTVNTAGVVGVDADLIVKPFGWKGREATLKRFVEGAFRVNFGIQSAPQVKKNCPTNGAQSTNVNLVGSANCPDPDGDGVVDELTEGGLTAMAIYMGLREIPVRVPAITAAAQARANSGEALFNNVGCASCHTRFMKINNPVHVEAADSVPNGGTGFNGITVDLRIDNKDPKPPTAADGSMTIEVFSDFKRHDVGALLADSKDFNQIKANQFITPPLWGIAVSAPYLHDGRARTLQDAILAHAGDAQAVRNSFAALTADQQSQIVEFLLTLGRQENKDAGKVDISNFLFRQIRPVGGGLFSTTTVAFPAGTLVPHGGRVVVARNASLAGFQAFYGRSLDDANTLFFTGGNAFPVILGTEQFVLFDSNGDNTTANVGVDGFTFPVATGQAIQRKDCGLLSTQSASWNFVAATPASVTPGIGPLSTGQNLICVTEVADSPMNSNFEFVELSVGTGTDTTSSGKHVDTGACQGATFSPTMSGGTSGGCQPDGCGLNGFWLGSGVSFRTLYLPDSNGFAPANDAGIRISKFIHPELGNLKIDIDVDRRTPDQELLGQQLLGRDVNGSIIVNSSNIDGSRLELEHLNSNEGDRTYLTIKAVQPLPFWAASGPGSPSQALRYDFTAIASDGCELALCQPGLDPDYPGSLGGHAVIFRGDAYTNDYRVNLLPPADNQFNIACVGTDLHKLHMLRHTSAASGSTSSPTLEERQALLRLLTADYCGIGHPFTANNTPIRFDSSNSNYRPLTGFGYLPDNNVSSVEAMWTKAGASCITAPRLPSVTLDLISHTCPLPPSCGSPPPGVNMPTFMNGLLSNRQNTLISGNPAP